MPLTRTRRKLLTCGFATPWLSPAPRSSAKRPYSLRERRDERDIADLITAYREGATAAVHGLSLMSVKRLLCIAGVRRMPPTRRDEGNAGPRRIQILCRKGIAERDEGNEP